MQFFWIVIILSTPLRSTFTSLITQLWEFLSFSSHVFLIFKIKVVHLIQPVLFVFSS